MDGELNITSHPYLICQSDTARASNALSESSTEVSTPKREMKHKQYVQGKSKEYICPIIVHNTESHHLICQSEPACAFNALSQSATEASYSLHYREWYPEDPRHLIKGPDPCRGITSYLLPYQYFPYILVRHHERVKRKTSIVLM